ncbi:hypothetical protein SISSUDRAFT_1044844 [Sistotremastrum suecicum HHB10207 ss-3]|uniref:Uncharacterized protein n=1 Tax=Sistotremastrum suecicum HHB10207 ss-3 TaxID=1314776 RepID=A0A166EX67_9AGAM|nr:hypothetical protein SISSUDRAFT_1044844 [Sistotremastrum suecicum HHB10207 ss-3]
MVILRWVSPYTSMKGIYRPGDAMLPFAALFNQQFTITDRAIREIELLLDREAEPSPSTTLEVSRRHCKEWFETMLNPSVAVPEFGQSVGWLVGPEWRR